MDDMEQCKVVTEFGLVVYRGPRGLCYDYVVQAMAKGSEPGFLRIIKDEEGDA